MQTNHSLELFFIVLGGTRGDGFCHGFVGVSVKPPFHQVSLGFYPRCVVQTSCTDFARLAMVENGIATASAPDPQPT